MSRAPRLKALCYAMFGARGAGKTASFVLLVNTVKPPRLMVWDYKADPMLRAVGKAVTTMAALHAATLKPTFCVRYIVDHDKDKQEQFDVFCRIAWEAGNLMMAVDELPEVTKANRAPPTWRKCVNVGRDYVAGGEQKSLSIVGIGQRPSECDKSFISNCDVWTVCRLTHKSDAVAMADPMGCDYRELMKLPDLHFIEKDIKKIDLERGVLSFSNGKPKAKLLPKAPSLRG